ncbi:MAG: YbaK/EbsC family protein [Burkholderiales bacterium]|nr:YbaK/EbsC family protein [Burkholderiales bacterium]
MPVKRLKDFLDREGVKYECIAHPPAFTARETAETAHVAVKDFAKTVMVRIGDVLAMVVLPASEKLDLSRLKHVAGGKHVRLALESEFDRKFPGCEPGAMPPFGNLYGMPVYVCSSLTADESIAFNAGTHAELVRMSYGDFARLVEPTPI